MIYGSGGGGVVVVTRAGPTREKHLGAFVYGLATGPRTFNISRTRIDTTDERESRLNIVFVPE